MSGWWRARANVYDHTLYILAGLLAGGLVYNLLVRPVADRWFTRTEPVYDTMPVSAAISAPRGAGALVGAAWLAVGLPLAWGFYMTLVTAVQLFG